jgi:hypothetical protein
MIIWVSLYVGELVERISIFSKRKSTLLRTDAAEIMFRRRMFKIIRSNETSHIPMVLEFEPVK